MNNIGIAFDECFEVRYMSLSCCDKSSQCMDWGENIFWPDYQLNNLRGY